MHEWIFSLQTKHHRDQLILLMLSTMRCFYYTRSWDILINELQVTSYELISLRVAFIARVTSYDLFLLHELRVTFWIRVTSSCLLHELRVTFYIRVTSSMSYELLLLHESRVIVCCTSYELQFIARVDIVKLSGYNVRKKVFSNKKNLEGFNVSITKSLTPKSMEILKKARIEHGFTNVWTSDGKILYKSSTGNRVKLYYK